MTIDGPAGVGKSTAAKLLARRLGLMYLDTGATYRALAYAALHRRPKLHAVDDRPTIASLARRLPITLRPLPDGGLQVKLVDQDITARIRTEEVSEAAAQISQYPEVRAAMVQLQRRLASERGVVVEGRDTGSVVFPRATYKFFLDAAPDIRARRRQLELMRLTGEKTSLAVVQSQLRFRDGLDRNRRVGPLVKPEGAIPLDTSMLTAREVVEVMMRQIGKSRPPSTVHRRPRHRATAFPRLRSGEAGRGPVGGAPASGWAACLPRR